MKILNSFFIKSKLSQGYASLIKSLVRFPFASTKIVMKDTSSGDKENKFELEIINSEVKIIKCYFYSDRHL